MEDPSILSLILLIVLSGIFSSLEIAYFSLSEAKIDVLVKKKKKGAKMVKQLKNNPEKLLITILVGNNIVNILSASIATVIALDHFGTAGIAIATFAMTILILMFGEILPKSLATVHAEKIVLLTSFPLFIFQFILSPIVKIFAKSTSIIMRLFKIHRSKIKVSDDELKAMAKIGVKEGTIEKNEQMLIKNALRFNDIEVGQIMTARVKMIALNEEQTLKESFETIKSAHFSRIPVFKNNEDNITGIFYVKDILSIPETDYINKKLKHFANKPLFTAETQKIDDLFRKFQQSRIHIAVVLDEHGGTAGIITLEDIIEELVGEINDETDKQIKFFRKLNNNTIIANAEAEMKIVMNFFDTEDIKDEEINLSVNGFLIEHMERIPKKGERYEKYGLLFSIEEGTEKMIKSVKINRIK